MRPKFDGLSDVHRLRAEKKAGARTILVNEVARGPMRIEMLCTLKANCHGPCLVVALLVALVPAAARAQIIPPEGDAQGARVFMEQGAAHYDMQDWEAARQAFLRAWELDRHPAIASNLAEVEMKLGRYVDAAEHLKFVLEAVPETVSEKRTIVEQDLAECRARVLSVRINVSVAGAEVVLNGRRLGTSPLADEIVVEPGTHVLEAFLPGFRPARSEVNGAPGTIAHVDLQLTLEVRNLTPRSTRAAPPSRAESWAPTSRNVLIYGASGLALLAAGAGMFYWAQSSSSAADARELRAQARSEGNPDLVAQNATCWPPEGMRPPVCGPLREKVEEQYRQRSIAIGAFIGAGVLASGAILTHFLWAPETDGSRVGSSTVVDGWANPVGAGIELRGRL